VDGTWTISELAELAAGVLAAEPRRQLSGRVREEPNDRLIRWYATVGLVDPPLSRTGRVARYGRRHLLQLVAIKRRQADGRSLAAIQAELVGATDAYLESVARLPTAVAGPDQTRVPESAGPAHADRAHEDRFWARAWPPERAAMPERGAGAIAALAQPDGNADAFASAKTSPLADLMRGIRLAPGVVLLLDGGPSAISAADAAEIAAAAAPLLRALARHGYPTGTDDREGNES
jgi:hypothetical protein